MPKKQNLSEVLDQELDFEDEEEEQEIEGEQEEDEGEEEPEEEEEKPRRKSSRDLEEVKSDLRDLKQMAAQLATSGNAEQKEKVKKLDALLHTLADQQWSKEQLAALRAIADAIREDMKEEQEELKKQDRHKSLQERCVDTMGEIVSRYEKKYPAVKWARHQIMTDAFALMDNSKSFASARSAFASGRRPAVEDFEKAVQRIVGVFLKESGIKGSGSLDELDTKSSRAKAAPAISKSGKVDLSKLSDDEKMVYLETKNVTKSEELALEALQAVRKMR